MNALELAAAVKTVVAAWQQANSYEQRCDALGGPAGLSASLAAAVEAALISAGADPVAIRQTVLAAPFAVLRGVFAHSRIA